MIKRGLLIVSFAIIAFANSFAQDSIQKIGHANVEYIMEKWPKIKTAQADIQDVENFLKNEIQLLSQEYQQKLQEAQANQDSLSQAELVSIEEDLIYLQGKIKRKENIAMTKMQEKFNTTMQPLLDLILEKIQEVGKEEGYTYIINQQSSATQTLIVLYSSNEKNDISDKVLKKLGVTVTTE